MCQQINGYVLLTTVHQFGTIEHHLDPFTLLHLTTNIKPQKKMYTVSFHDSTDTSPQFFIMDATQYWPFAREYSIWNAAVATLQFWMADLEPQTLSNAIEWVYTAFFSSNSA